MELEEYINLDQRVSGRMTLVDVSATGEENLIERDSGSQMNDIESWRKQLLKLQDAVVDLEDISSGLSISDLTLTDFRRNLAEYDRARPGEFAGSRTSRSWPGWPYCRRPSLGLHQYHEKIS